MFDAGSLGIILVFMERYTMFLIFQEQNSGKIPENRQKTTVLSMNYNGFVNRRSSVRIRQLAPFFLTGNGFPKGICVTMSEAGKGDIFL